MSSTTLALLALLGVAEAFVEIEPTRHALLFAKLPSKKGNRKKDDKSTYTGGNVIQGGCSNTCAYKNDGDCDDGGDGSEYDYCAAGTDCNDCTRVENAGGPQIDNEGNLVGIPCDCYYSSDQDCDDGGAGSDYNVCALGSDCQDCPQRTGDDLSSDAARKGARERYEAEAAANAAYNSQRRRGVSADAGYSYNS